MKALVVGASGFVGLHLLRELAAHGHEVYAAAIEQHFKSDEVPSERTIVANIENVDDVDRMLRRVNPDWIINLAAQSSVSRSWTDPVETAHANILGPLVLFEGVRKLKLQPRILCIGSSEEYGDAKFGTAPVPESIALAPRNPYAATKCAQELFATTYCNAYKMDIVLVRAFPHIGPGQNRGFVIPDFCEQIAKAELEAAAPIVKVGNLHTSRDLTDVRDIVRGYRLLLESGKSGEVYNIGSGKAQRIGDLLNILVSMASRPLQIQEDSTKLRPLDVSGIVADSTRIRTSVGWRQEIPIEKSLANTLDYWRRRSANSP